MNITLGDLSLRALTRHDADLLVDATRDESAPALWGPYPAGPYSLADAWAALRAWDYTASGPVSYGMLGTDARLVAALGLMPDEPGSAELAYWVRPDRRRLGIGLRGVRAVTQWAHEQAGLKRVWLEINPDNAPSLGLAEQAGYRFEQVMPQHCRSWIDDDPRYDAWHDCLIWEHRAESTPVITHSYERIYSR